MSPPISSEAAAAGALLWIVCVALTMGLAECPAWGG